MTFYVRKTLAQGPIRFGVSPRRMIDDIDTEAALSTGAEGEFLRRSGSGFYFADNRARAKGGPELHPENGASGAPFWKSVVDGTQRGWIFLGMMSLGALLFLIGLAVVARKGAAGWIEVLLGAALAATPIVLTAQTRRKVREAEQKVRAARAEEDRRHQAALAAYAQALDRMLEDTNDLTLAATAREHDAIMLPYELWSPYGRSTVVRIGFKALAKLTPSRAKEIDHLLTRASHAAGLSPADELSVKLDVYRTAVWHLLADDRLGEPQAKELAALRQAFDIGEGDVPAEEQSMEEFQRLRGVTKAALPKESCPIPLGFHEHCLHDATGSVMRSVRNNLVPSDECKVHVTTRQVILESKKRQEIALKNIDDVEVDVDANILTIRTARGSDDVALQVNDPIYTAALIDIATTIDDRPRAFA